jgi:1-acyl-sn-glycerol-3-phosphate acyltransferase
MSTPEEPVPLSSYDGSKDPFLNRTARLSVYNKLKFVFPGLLLAIPRLVGAVGLVSTAAVVITITNLGRPRMKRGEEAPVRGWRRIGPLIVSTLARGVLFCLGFHRIRVHGKPAPPSVAPIVVGNHVAPWDGLALLHFSGATFVSRSENAKIPIVGTVIKGLQCVLVDRDSAGSRDAVVQEICRRSTTQGWPPLCIFPEGTTINGTALLQFRTGAFQAGVPVQPVTVKYRFAHMDPSWSGTIGLGQLLLRLVTQFYNTMEVTYHPVYVPTDAEVADPVLFALGVRTEMSKRSGIPLSDYSIEDYSVLTEACRLGISQEDALIGVEHFRRITNLGGSDIKLVLKSFHEMDPTSTGLISYEAFRKALGMPDHASTRHAFVEVSGGADTIDFKHFLQSTVYISRQLSTDEKIHAAFEIINVAGDGRITLPELSAIMSIIAPDSTPASVSAQFKAMDTRRVGFVDLFEFGTFLRARPHYMHIFETVREAQRSKGANAVLDMLAMRAQGIQMSLEDFNARVKHYQRLANQ